MCVGNEQAFYELGGEVDVFIQYCVYLAELLMWSLMSCIHDKRTTSREWSFLFLDCGASGLNGTDPGLW
jgi:hypothetical protein